VFDTWVHVNNASAVEVSRKCRFEMVEEFDPAQFTEKLNDRILVISRNYEILKVAVYPSNGMEWSKSGSTPYLGFLFYKSKRKKRRKRKT
jgi:hypothetical protein